MDLTKCCENEGKQGDDKLESSVSLHLLNGRLRRSAVCYHHCHLGLLLATRNNKQAGPCANQRLALIRHTNKHKLHTHRGFFLFWFNDICVPGILLVVLQSDLKQVSNLGSPKKTHFTQNRAPVALKCLQFWKQ